MKIIKSVVLILIVFLFFSRCQTDDGTNPDDGTVTQGFIIDHNCTDISKIPEEWINRARESWKVHYAHTSHGEQITEGLKLLSNDDSRYRFYSADCAMPVNPNGLRMMDGQYIQQYGYCETYITPDLYWESDFGMNITRWVLNNMDINVSQWAWCSQLDYYSESEVNQYLERLNQLETEFPDVTFIYMTGNAQSVEANRYQRNNQIRDYCRNNNKILFDFGDLDCWYNGQQHLEDGIPCEHPQYHGDQAGHTTYESCRNKARAFWWLLARMAGWDGT